MSNTRLIADILQESLPALQAGQLTIDELCARHSEVADELRPQAQAALWLQHQGEALQPRAGYVAAASQRLVSDIRASQSGNRWQRLLKRAIPRRMSLQLATQLLLLLCLAFVLNNLALASRLALPGDSLYPLKLALEEARLTFSLSPANDTRLHIEFSKNRTTEIVELTLEGKYTYIPFTAARLEEQINRTQLLLAAISERRPAQAQELSSAYEETLSSEAFILSILRDTSPPNARPALELAIRIAHEGLMELASQ